MEVKIYDTTLRDGTQAEDFCLSAEDKVRIALKLDDVGIHFIEGGWPGSNPKDADFFREIRNYHLRQARIAAFGSTHHPASTAASDPNLKALLDANTELVTIFGKSWTVHVKEALHTSTRAQPSAHLGQYRLFAAAGQNRVLRRGTFLRWI